MLLEVTKKMPRSQTLINNLATTPSSASAKFNRDSVERALTVHLGANGDWLPDGKGGYTISTTHGIIRLRTVREAAIFVYGCAEKRRRMERGK